MFFMFYLNSQVKISIHGFVVKLYTGMHLGIYLLQAATFPLPPPLTLALK